MLKFGRSYTLLVEASDGSTISIQNPLTLELSVKRSFLASVNVGTMRVFNLGAVTRNLLYNDPWDILRPEKRRRVTLKAGYGSNQAIIFDGFIQTIVSYRASGSVNFITEITGYDGGSGTVNAQTKLSYLTSVGRDQVVNDLVREMAPYGVQVGKVDPLYPGLTYPRGRTFVGKTWTLLQTETCNRAFIDSGRLYVLADNSFSAGQTLLITSATGLLGTPKRQANSICVDILFEPQVQIMQQVELRSLDSPIYSGIWEVRGISHNAVISDAVSGDAITTLELYTGDRNFGALAQGIAA